MQFDREQFCFRIAILLPDRDFASGLPKASGSTQVTSNTQETKIRFLRFYGNGFLFPSGNEFLFPGSKTQTYSANTCNDHEYAPVQHSFLWVLDAGRLMLNAKCITRGMVKSKLMSCCCFLLTTAEPGHLHQETDYFISLVFWTQMRKKGPLQVKDCLK